MKELNRIFGAYLAEMSNLMIHHNVTAQDANDICSDDDNREYMINKIASYGFSRADVENSLDDCWSKARSVKGFEKRHVAVRVEKTTPPKIKLN